MTSILHCMLPVFCNLGNTTWYIAGSTLFHNLDSVRIEDGTGKIPDNEHYGNQKSRKNLRRAI